MERIYFNTELLQDEQYKTFLAVTAEWQGKALTLDLTSLLTFLFQNEKLIDKDDSEFCYTLAKCIKKVKLGENFILAIANNIDIAIFFMSAIKHNISFDWTHNNKRIPAIVSETLPLTIDINESDGYLICEMEDRDSWLTDPFAWMIFSHNKNRIFFSKGTIVQNIPQDIENFLANFFESGKIYYKEHEIVQFIKEVYSPNKNALRWNVEADLSSVLPQETTPAPLLTLNYQDSCLAILLGYQYENEVIDSTDNSDLITDRQTGKSYKRMFDMEAIYQQDLMLLFEENELPFMLQSPGDIAKFMDKVVPVLIQREWMVNSNVPEFTVLKDPIDLEFAIDSSGKDWFYFEPNCKVGNQNISLQEIARLLVRNDGYLKTKKGFVKVSDSSQKELETLSSFGAFKVGKKFSKSEILPLIAASTTKGSNEATESMIDRINNFHKVDHCEPSKNFSGELRPYQQYGMNWMNFLFQIGLGGVLADDMGLGKTVQVIAFTTQLQRTKPVLVVCPTNVVYNWRNEIDKFAKGQKTLIYTGNNRHKHLKSLKDYDFIITTYGLIKNDLELLSKIDFQAIFLDEAQYIKNPQAQISKATKALRADYKIAMTGTPIENHLLDLWSLFDFVMPDYLGNRKNFEDMIKDGQKEQIKTKIRPFILRREKKEVLDCLPDKTEIVKKCPLSEQQSALYATVLKAVKQGIRNNHGKVERLNILTSLLKLRQVCTHPGIMKEFQDSSIPSAKFDMAKEMIAELIDENHKIVLFSQFTGMLDILQDWVKEEDLYFERIDGSVSAQKRIKAIDRFQSSETPGVFLISLKAGGIGINLTEADYVIHLDPWWNPAVEAQATDRVHRMGQKNKVIVYKLITEGTIEEKIFDLQEEKKTLIGEIIDIDSMDNNKINLKELKSLLV
jgi:superfamily II DNA or RNA helicase